MCNNAILISRSWTACRFELPARSCLHGRVDNRCNRSSGESASVSDGSYAGDQPLAVSVATGLIMHAWRSGSNSVRDGFNPRSHPILSCVAGEDHRC
eukprot:365942-Chlamydomonas_euryale.AAC.13